MTPRAAVRALRFVLVRPRNPNNIGAAARALANFGFAELFVVDPHSPVWREARAAVGGEAVLGAAQAGSLGRALRGAHLVLGTSDGRRGLREPLIPLPALGAWLKGRLPARGRLAVLFGPEKTGLTRAELQHCRALVRIPTRAEAPSMNLGQAVAVLAYELSRAALPSRTSAPKLGLPTAEQREDLLARALAALDRVGYMKGTPVPAKAEKLRRMMRGWSLSRQGAAFLQGVFRRVAALAVLLCLGLSHAATAQTAGRSLRLHADLIGRHEPKGIMAVTGLALRRSYGGAPGTVGERYVQSGVGLGLNPAYAQTSVHGEWSPLAAFTLRAQYDLYTYFGAHDGLLSFPGGRSAFGDRERDALSGREEARLGQRFLLQPALRLKAGRWAFRNQADIARYRFSGRGPFFLELEYDALLKSPDALLANRIQILYEFIRRDSGRTFLAGPYHEGVWAQGAASARHRLGAFLYFIPATRLGSLERPRLYLLPGITLQDPNRKGRFFLQAGLGADFSLWQSSR